MKATQSEYLRRLMGLVNKTESCWLWIGGTSRGYGKFRMGDKIVQAHVASWILHNGGVPDGKEVMHNCPSGDNKACINPSHLMLGSHRENMQDMVAKGRSSKGTIKRAMSASEIREAKEMKLAGMTYASIKEALGFDDITLWRAVNNKTRRSMRVVV